jgi:hypothetical protein
VDCDLSFCKSSGDSFNVFLRASGGFLFLASRPRIKPGACSSNEALPLVPFENRLKFDEIKFCMQECIVSPETIFQNLGQHDFSRLELVCSLLLKQI